MHFRTGFGLVHEIRLIYSKIKAPGDFSGSLFCPEMTLGDGVTVSFS